MGIGVAVDVFLFFASAGLGHIAKLATFNKLRSGGVGYYKALAASGAVGLGTEVTVLWGLNTAKAAWNEDLSKVFSTDYLAKSYGSTLLMVGLGMRLPGAVRTKVAEKLATKFTKDGVKLTLAGKILVPTTSHSIGIGGFIGSTQVGHLVGLSDKPIGGWKEGLVNDVFTYVEFAVARRMVDNAVQGKLSRTTAKLDNKVQIAQAKARDNKSSKPAGGKIADTIDFTAYVVDGIVESVRYYFQSRAENKKARRIADSKKPKKSQPEDFSDGWGRPKGPTDGDGWAEAAKTSKKTTKPGLKVANDNKAADPHATADMTGGKRPVGVESSNTTIPISARNSEKPTLTTPAEATTTAINHKTFIVDLQYVDYYTSAKAKAEYQHIVDNFDALAKEMNWSAAEKSSYKNDLIRFKEHLDYLEKNMNLTSGELSRAKSTDRSNDILSQYSNNTRPRLDKLQGTWYDQMNSAASQMWTNARTHFRSVESTMTALEIRSNGAFDYGVKLKSPWELRTHIDPTKPADSFKKVAARDAVSYDIKITDPAKARKALDNDHYFSEKQRIELAQYLIVEKGWGTKEITDLFGADWVKSHMQGVKLPAAANL